MSDTEKKVLSDDEALTMMRKAQTDYTAVRDASIGFKKDAERDQQALEALKAKLVEKYGTASVEELKARINTIRQQNSEQVVSFAEAVARDSQRVAAATAALNELDGRK